MPSFLDELVALEKLENINKKGKKKMSICTNCGEIFEQEKGYNKRKSCSETCRLQLLSKSRKGVRPAHTKTMIYFNKKRDIIDLDVHETDATQEVPEEPKETSNEG